MRYKLTIEGFIEPHLWDDFLATARDNYALEDYFYCLRPTDGFIDVGAVLYCESDELEDAHSLAYLFDINREVKVTIEDLESVARLEMERDRWRYG